MLPKAHLTFHSRKSDSRWVIAPSWLSGSLRSFLYSSSVYSWHHLLISSTSVRSMPFLSFIVPISAVNGVAKSWTLNWTYVKCSLGISNFLEEMSSLSHSVVFLCFFALITEEGFLISPYYSLELCIQMGISFLFPLPLASLLFSAICKASSDNNFAFLFLGNDLDHCLLYNVMNLHP